MTVVAAVKLSGNPVVIGDAVISYKISDKPERFGSVSKVYRFGENVVLGWSGPVADARDVIAKLSAELRGPRIQRQALKEALCALPERPGLQLTGWLIDDDGPYHVYWSGELPRALLCLPETIIGDGREPFQRLLEHRGEGNVTGIYETVCKAMLSVAEALLEEMLYPEEWFPTWGAAYDVAFYAEGTFMWAPPMTCLAWDCHMNSRGEVLSIHRHPVMVKQLRVHDRLVVQVKEDSENECTTEVCEPVHQMMRAPFVESTPFSPKAFFYASYVRLFVEERYVDKMSFLVVRPDAAGPLIAEDDPVHGVHFRLDASEIAQTFRESFPSAFVEAPLAVAGGPSPNAMPPSVPDEPARPDQSPAGVAASPGPGPWNRKLRTETVLALARENAAALLAGAERLFGGQTYVLVAGDASGPLGETFVVSGSARKDGDFAQARAHIRAQVASRHAFEGNLGFTLLLSATDTVSILQQTAVQEQIATVVELTARFTTPPPHGQAHCLLVAAGEVLATLVPLIGGEPAPSVVTYPNFAGQIALEMSPETRTLALNVVAEAVGKGARIEDGIAVLVDPQQPGGLEFMMALTPEPAANPEGVMARLSAQATGRRAAVAWLSVHQVVAVLRRAGLDEAACLRILGPSPPGEFRVALVGADTVVTTMPIAA